MPNEYTIETASGVYATLSAMPNFARYVPNAEETKSALKYQFWGRTTLQYSPSCEKSIIDAVDVLD